jgi:hypothetical protein
MAIGAATTETPQWPRGRRGRIPEGLFRARNGDSTAPFAPKSQSFLDHLVAGFRPKGCHRNVKGGRLDGQAPLHRSDRADGACQNAREWREGRSLSPDRPLVGKRPLTGFGDPGWIAASPSSASRSSNAFVKPWANMSATVRPCCASASSWSARRCWTLVVMAAYWLGRIPCGREPSKRIMAPTQSRRVRRPGGAARISVFAIHYSYDLNRSGRGRAT